jgi:hypothetical protein
MTFLEYAAVERRATPRHSILRAGTILIGNGSTNCMARNMSIVGAMLSGLTLAVCRVWQRKSRDGGRYCAVCPPF